jgi:two-component system sensor histidine kinase HydH
LKYQVLNINIVIQKSFVYSILIAIISTTYFIFVFLAERFFQGMFGYTSLIVSIIYAITIALFFIPVKNRIQHFADKIFLGKDLVQIARENELMKQELERSERLKAVAHFASGMAHEIKNPLTAIKTFTEYLPEKKNDPEFLNKFSNIVSGEVDRIDSLVHQLLDFAKPSPLKLEETDIHKLLVDTLNLLSNDFIKCKIKVNTDYTDKKLIIHIDPNRMKQAFLNIFLNALEAMPSGGTLSIKTIVHRQQTIDGSVDHRPSTMDSKVIIEVIDTGCGIPEKDLPHIFEPFYSTKENGTGLGLSIVYNIIKEHGGSIKAETKTGEGTRFVIELTR